MTGLYQKYRPQTLDEVVGQPDAVRVLEKFFANGGPPHAILFHGGSGTGKTTLARIIAARLGCDNNDMTDINCAKVEPMDTVRAIAKQADMTPMFGPVRVWILDEFQAMSRAGFAQQAMLKVLEDVRDTSYFLLCTTDPNKIIPTVRNRCTIIATKPVSNADLHSLTSRVCKAEKVVVDSGVLNTIDTAADGSPRKALVLLEQVIGLKSTKEQLAAIERTEASEPAIQLCRALMGGRPWAEVAKILKGLDGEEPEGLRHMMLSYARTTLLGGGQMAPKAFLVIQAFRDHLFDSRHAGLVANCWEVVEACRKTR